MWTPLPAAVLMILLLVLLAGCKEECLDDCEDDYEDCLGGEPSSGTFSGFDYEADCKDAAMIEGSAQHVFCVCTYDYEKCKEDCEPPGP